MKRLLQTLIVLAVGAVSALYLVNPSFGLFELIPDNLPMVGNLDEADATALLVGVARYFGLDVTKIFERKPKEGPEVIRV